MKKSVIITLVLMVFLPNAFSQTMYNCDFEYAAENAAWNLNISANPNLSFINKWYIGSAIHNGGQNSLYISKDGGATAGYSGGGMMIAARSIDLQAGEYDLSFDWLCSSDAGQDIMFVGWVPDSVRTNSSTTGAKPFWFDAHGLLPDAETPPVVDSLRSSSWKTSLFRIHHDGTPHKLVFCFASSSTNSLAKGACVDNIQIMPKDLCSAPRNLQVSTSGNTVTLSWNGSAALYEAKYFSARDNYWVGTVSTTASNITFYGVNEGMHNFYVRSVCDTVSSRWVSLSELIYLPDMRCIDYLTLTNQNCWTGTTSNDGRGSRQVVNDGYWAKTSRHTVHYVDNEYDPRTYYRLKTVPDGEIASVRLGNWATNSEAEQIEYTYTVDAANAAVLLLKYAVIMDEPSTPHLPHQQAKFSLKITKANGAPLANSCGEADFIASYDTQGDNSWHQVVSPLSSGNNIWWKEWTTIGINLAEYDGETLKIILKTADCTQTGHFCYAYFTLGCTNGQMEGISCGDTPTNQFIAPEGFNYRWYLPNNPNAILGTNRTFDVDASDTLIYNCDVIFPTNAACYFTLNASAVPRYPVASGSYEKLTANCKNIVKFNNLSHIMLKNQVTLDTTHTPVPCETAHWDFGDGFTSAAYSPEHEFPAAGGRFSVRLVSGISRDVCMDDTTFIIDFPSLLTTYDTVQHIRCNGSSFAMPDGTLKWQTGKYSYTYRSRYGCDSVVVFDVKFYERINIEIYDTICSNETYQFNGQTISAGGTYTASGQSVFGCDSTTTLHLTVLDALDVQLKNFAASFCADGVSFAIPFEVRAGKATGFSLTFDEKAQNAGFVNQHQTPVSSNPIIVSLPASLRPDRYNAMLTFASYDCENAQIPLAFTALYPSSVITQRWNDVLAVKNAEYNGGYEFSAYQWYKNSRPIADAVKHFLNEQLDFTAQYQVELTRDGVAILSCGFVPARVAEPIMVYPTAVAQGSAVTVKSNVEISGTLYNSFGVNSGNYSFAQGENKITMPAAKGIYLLKIENAVFKISVE